ncbi:NAD-dependent epimerase/dehydratase family protein [Sporomusa malonica]|uniref:Nucleoside-diphosphate-sugar epimerase n=1 Tax=Sporomusa malonica TaxID=112901 RepID=A0A1W1YSG3_9FIRM|nr:NAD-dependent epimerase/dehydratase family protein [Sporomusa malonica]SMC39089.1 Nucleoside-diphosphate-sugar epimerase [Sporomusa malonica]
MMKTALVTGGTGYIGNCLARRLADEHWNVHVLVRDSSKVENLDNNTNSLIFHQIGDNYSDLNALVSQTKPDVVFHLASLFLSQHKYEDIAPLIDSNIAFGAHLVNAMVESGVKNLINTGTSWQHYMNQAYNPVCLYAATKQAFEAMLRYYQEAKGLQVITLKLSDTYGPGDQRPKLMQLLLNQMNKKTPLDMSPGEQQIDLVYIDDVLDAFLLAANYLVSSTSEYTGDYAVSSCKPIKLKDLVTVFEAVSGQALEIRWGGRPYREREVMQTWDKGKLIPGWAPKVSLAEGVARLLNHK